MISVFKVQSTLLAIIIKDGTLIQHSHTLPIGANKIYIYVLICANSVSGIDQTGIVMKNCWLLNRSSDSQGSILMFVENIPVCNTTTCDPHFTSIDNPLVL